MQQSKLAFTKVTAEQAWQQREVVAQTFAQEHPVAAEPPPAKRGPGRPKRVIGAGTVMGAAAAAAAAEPAEPSAKRHKAKPGSARYVDWLHSPQFHLIFTTYQQCGHSSKRALAVLQRASPELFATLAFSTIRSWFDDDDRTLPKPMTQRVLEGHAAQRQMGRPAALSKHPEVEQLMQTTLLKMREAGTPLNSHVIRWTLTAIMKTHQPSLLQELELSKSWISAWVRSTLKWSWRKSTTTQGKLPLDWETQGMHMARRIAALMQMHKVR